MAEPFIKYKKHMLEPYMTDMNMDHWSDAAPDYKWTISFPELMTGLGFEMDCGKSFDAVFPGVRCFDISNDINRELIKKCLRGSDTSVVGNYIFSLYRYLTHWNESAGAMDAEEERFIKDLLDILDGKLQGYLFLDDIPIEDTPEAGVVCLAGDPAPEITLEDIHRMIDKAESEKAIADAYAVASNKAFWIEDTIYDYDEGTEEYAKACKETDDWFAAMTGLEERIYDILRAEGYEIPETARRGILSIFMGRNGYRDGRGWWIPIK